MNLVYIILIIIIAFSLVTGICVTIIENKEIRKLDLISNSVEEGNIEESNTIINNNPINTSINDTIRVGDKEDDSSNNIELPQMRPYSIVDEEII